MRIVGRRDDLLLLHIGGGMAVVMDEHRRLVSPAFDLDAASEVGSFAEADSSLEARRRAQATLDQCKTAPFMAFQLGDRSKYPGGKYPNEQEGGTSERTSESGSHSITAKNERDAEGMADLVVGGQKERSQLYGKGQSAESNARKDVAVIHGKLEKEGFKKTDSFRMGTKKDSTEVAEFKKSNDKIFVSIGRGHESYPWGVKVTREDLTKYKGSAGD